MKAMKAQKRNFRRLLSPVVLFLIGLTCLLVTLSARPTHALDGSSWDPGHIIDDGIFKDSGALNVNQIQQFLNSKVPSCDNWGAQQYANTGKTVYQYFHPLGYKFPLTCLKDYYENPSNNQNNLTQTDGQAASIPSGAISAAQIFVNAAQSYGINPEVLIVLVQKESGMIGDSSPLPIQYQSATGYGCPDYQACNNQYAGFNNQVNDAAWQFQQYNKNPNSFSYTIGSGNNILYNPNSGCGSSNVTIANQSTADLYDYTPYQPNQAALNNLYGTGDSCSSYGNRNFWRDFTDYFGSPRAAPFNWQPTRLTIMDQGKNVEIPTDTVHPGERLFVTLTGVNTGSQTWWRDGVNPPRLGTVWPPDHSTPYCDTSWLGISAYCNRAASTVESSVPPGGTFTFQFYTAVPNTLGQYWEHFQPVLEGRAWMTNDPGFSIYVNSTNFYNWQWQYFNAWTDSSKTVPIDMNNLAANQQVFIELFVKNMSATVWNNSGPNQVDLATSSPQDRISQICTGSWIRCNRPATMVQTSVNPGQVATFDFTIKAPSQSGVSREYFRPVVEQSGWMRDDFNHIYLNVTH